MGRWGLHFDDVRTEQGGQVRCIGGDVDRRLAILRQVAAARVGPQDDCEAGRFRLRGQFLEFLHHLELVVGAGINREPDGGTT